VQFLVVVDLKHGHGEFARRRFGETVTLIGPRRCAMNPGFAIPVDAIVGWHVSVCGEKQNGVLLARGIKTFEQFAMEFVEAAFLHFLSHLDRRERVVQCHNLQR